MIDFISASVWLRLSRGWFSQVKRLLEKKTSNWRIKKALMKNRFSVRYLRRTKNTVNILLKNLLDLFFGAISYWAIGWIQIPFPSKHALNSNCSCGALKVFIKWQDVARFTTGSIQDRVESRYKDQTILRFFCFQLLYENLSYF